MSKVSVPVEIPLDQGFVRRQCPYCYREFKALLSETERQALVRRFEDAFWLDTEGHVEDQTSDEASEQLTCPYCGQRADKGTWWTHEQLAYMSTFLENILADHVNALRDRMTRTSGRSRGSLVSFKVTGEKMRKREPWISPETDDMVVIALPCCSRKLKVAEDWSDTVYCFFCGFPHRRSLLPEAVP